MPEYFEMSTEALTQQSGVTLWRDNDYLVPVCWATTGLDYEKQIIEQALLDSWHDTTSLYFTFTAACPTSGTDMYLKIAVHRSTDPDAAKGASGLGMSNTLKSPSQSPGVDLSFGINASQANIEYVGVHEIGHALGFRHEQYRPENNEPAGYCRNDAPAGASTDWLGPYDQESIMNYCCGAKSVGNMLTEIDIHSVREVYGWPGRAIDIGLGPDVAEPWVIGVSGRVFRWSGSDWEVMREGSHIAIDVGPDGNAWIIDSNNAIYRYNGSSWIQLPGYALDIGVGADGTAWVVGISGNAFRWNGTSWELMRSGSHIAIDVDPDGQAWVVDSALSLWHNTTGTTWIQDTSLSVLDVAVSSNGIVFAVNESDHTVVAWDGSTWQAWPRAKEDAQRISAGPHAQVAVVDDDERIFVNRKYGWPDDEWNSLPGTANDVGVGADGSIWVIGSSERLFRWDGVAFQLIDSGSFLALDVGPDGTAWVIDNSHAIYHYDGSSFVQLPGAALDIGVGADGTAWVVGISGGLFRWNGTSWDLKRSGSHVAIDVFPDGSVIAIDSSQAIWRWFGGSSWIQLPGNAKDITIDSSGRPWVVGSSDRLFIYLENWIKQREAAHIRLDVGDRPWVIAADNSILENVSGTWVTRPGSGLDIGIGANGAVWVVGTSKRIFRWNGTSWDLKRSGDHIAIDVDPYGNAWAIDSSNAIYRYDGFSWNLLPGSALDIGIGANGSVWMIGTSGGVYSWNGSGWDLERSGVHSAISVGPLGNPIVTTSTGRILNYNGVEWIYQPGGGLDVAVGNDGELWSLGSESTNVFKLEGKWAAMETAPGSLASLSAGQSGEVVVLEQSGHIWLREEFGLTDVRDIAVGDDPDVAWAIDDRTGNVIRWNGQDWEVKRSGSHIAVEVGPNDTAWAIDSTNTILRKTSSGWQTSTLSAIDIGVGTSGDVWAVAISGNVYQLSGSSWVPMRGGNHIAIDVDPDGNAWVIDSSNHIFHYNGSSWDALPGNAYDVGIGADGNAWVIGTSASLFRFAGSDWEKAFNAGPQLMRVSGAPDGRAALVDDNGKAVLF